MPHITKNVNNEEIYIFYDFNVKFEINDELICHCHDFIFMDKDNIIGRCMASPFVTPKINGIFISHFEINEEYRNKGFGKNIYKTIEHIYKKEGFSKIELSTPETNSQGKAFWLKMGFEFNKVNLSKYI